MVARLRNLIWTLWRAAPFATVVLAMALAASLFFGVRAAVFWIDRPPMAEREQPIAAWMTPRLVARSWGVPREVLQEVLGTERPRPDGPVSLREFADLRGVPVEVMIADLEAAIAAFRADHGHPPDTPASEAER